jgi:hypothetical protein
VPTPTAHPPRLAWRSGRCAPLWTGPPSTSPRLREGWRARDGRPARYGRLRSRRMRRDAHRGVEDLVGGARPCAARPPGPRAYALASRPSKVTARSSARISGPRHRRTRRVRQRAGEVTSSPPQCSRIGMCGMPRPPARARRPCVRPIAARPGSPPAQDTHFCAAGVLIEIQAICAQIGGYACGRLREGDNAQ